MSLSARENAAISAWLRVARDAIPSRTEDSKLRALAEEIDRARTSLERVAPGEEETEPPPSQCSHADGTVPRLREAIEVALEIVRNCSSRHTPTTAKLYGRLASLHARIAALRLVDLAARRRFEQTVAIQIQDHALLETVARHPENNARFSCFRAVPNLARNGWREMGREHFVQIYEEESDLLHSLGEYLADGLWQGERVVIIATESHRSELDRRLREKSIDVASAVVTRSYLALDAQETLDKFMVESRPDPVLFNATVGAVVRAAARGGRRIRAFGEMVAILMGGGNRAGAIRLEELWNELLREVPCALFCAYPASCVCGESPLQTLTEICDTHTRVIPPASFAA